MNIFKIKKIIVCLLIVFFVSSCYQKTVVSDDVIAEKSDSMTIENNYIKDETTGLPPNTETDLKMIYYEGNALNIFFHPLVARPEAAFSSNYKDHFLDWYITADEYKKILNELYMNDYVLVDINELYDVIYSDGAKKVVGKKVLVPEGKKPLILSIDDLSYYKFVRENASVHKLVIDEKGDIAAWTDGGGLSYDLDVVTILEDFIKQRPDFSIRGAKGIIALTGYEGVLGYQTQVLNAPDYQERAEQAAAVADKLKELGWRFASHSYTHWNMAEIPMERFINCANWWDSQVRIIIGDTDLYIYPFGAGVENQAQKHKLLRDRNFNVFFGVGTGFNYFESDEYIFMDRRNIDGIYFKTFRNRQDRLFDIDKVIDDKRTWQ